MLQSVQDLEQPICIRAIGEEPSPRKGAMVHNYEKESRVEQSHTVKSQDEDHELLFRDMSVKRQREE